MTSPFLSLPQAEQLAAAYGTPLYIYDAATIHDRLDQFRRAFADLPMKLFYAGKALTNQAILRLMQEAGTGLDTVSLNEIHLGLRAGFAPEDILFTPNCVAFAEIEQAVELGAQINLENLQYVEQFGQRYGGRVPCCIRLHPDIGRQGEATKVSDWHHQSKFGIARKHIKQVHALRKRYGMRITGVHIHSSSKIMNPAVFLAGAEVVFALARDFPDLEFLDFGGGIKPPEQPGGPAVDIHALGKAFTPRFEAFARDMKRDLQLYFEPGRWLVMEAGALLTQATAIKNNGHVDIIGLDTGFNHLIRPMMYGAYHPIVNLSRPDTAVQPYHVAGNICEIDYFAKDRLLPKTEVGDLLAILNAGAYGFSMASTYNSRFRPAEVLMEGEKVRLIRRRETLADLLANQVE
ncbi:MAG: diaminopimelate decarboxylase [Bacteroidota bacterium]